MIRTAHTDDLPAIVSIYNHYVRETPITFDLEETSLEKRLSWYEQFSEAERYQLVVSEHGGTIDGYAHSTPFRPKPAYRRSVETTVYLSPTAMGQGLAVLCWQNFSPD